MHSRISEQKANVGAKGFLMVPTIELLSHEGTYDKRTQQSDLCLNQIVVTLDVGADAPGYTVVNGPLLRIGGNIALAQMARFNTEDVLQLCKNSCTCIKNCTIDIVVFVHWFLH